MINNFEEAQKFGKEQFDAMTAVATSIARGLANGCRRDN
jgi:hypothetical protein